NIQLPRNGSKKVEFSAYAFNADRVKSDTARTTFDFAPLAQTAKPKAYVIVFGVNAYDLTDWRLGAAVSDAQVTKRNLTERLTSQYDVVPIELTSDFDGPKNAVKDNVRRVLERLSGVSPSNDDATQLTAALGDATVKRISRSTPQDIVIIAFSSHGAADAAGNFYILPSDIKRNMHPKDKADTMPDRNSMISSDELSLWMRDMDSSDAVMIIDACYAAASVNSAGFKPAPMGSRGLGQLAYDKQMRILTATRENDKAVEVTGGGGKIHQGLLTYALITEGLDPAKGNITISKWLEFARDEVPVLYDKLEKGLLKSDPVPETGVEKDQKVYLQQPVLFDFRRTRTSDIQLVNTK
ncbi:MAG: caspase family protein, partial [Acidobacteria bacterium]|nr:caspase family protein [Acidobacteriota bacterium]